MTRFQKVMARLGEPSTWAGLAAIIIAVTGWSTEQYGVITAAVIAIVAAVATFKKDPGSDA